MLMSSIVLCEELAKQVPDLKSLLAEHVEDNDEILPHVFMGDVTRYVLADGRDRRRVVKMLEEAFATADEDVNNLIAVSFVENMALHEELSLAIEGVEAPFIRKEWMRQHSETDAVPPE